MLSGRSARFLFAFFHPCDYVFLIPSATAQTDTKTLREFSGVDHALQRAVCLNVDKFFYFLAKDDFLIASIVIYLINPVYSGVFR